MKSFSELTSASYVSNSDILAISQENSGTYSSKKTTVKEVSDFANQNFAEEYDSTSSYAVGDYCIYESVLYKCTASTTGSFDNTKWTSVVVTNEMGSGGGGTGGHTIIDENGNSMTARAGLQFVGGANVSDDGTNNKTIVDLASAGGIDGVFVDTDNLISSGTLSNSGTTSYTATEDCYFIGYSSSGSALAYLIDNVTMIFAPTNQTHSLLLKKGQTLTVGEASTYSIFYKIYGIQTGTTHSKFQPVIYSTEEQEIGVWTDGKPLYQKSYVGIDITVSYNSWGSSGITLSNVDTIVKAFGTATDGSFQGDIMAWNDSGDLKLQTGRNGRDSNVDLLTIQYTKTSDVAGSGTWTPQGVPAVHYSTDEQVIGIDENGNTLYEKFYHVANVYSSNTVVDSSLTNANTILKGLIFGSFNIGGAYANTQYCTPHIGTNADIRVFMNASGLQINAEGFNTSTYPITDCYFRVQYIKTS